MIPLTKDEVIKMCLQFVSTKTEREPMDDGVDIVTYYNGEEWIGTAYLDEEECILFVEYNKSLYLEK